MSLLNISNIGNKAYETSAKLWEQAQHPGEVQKTAQAAVRTFIGIASFYYFPVPAAIAGTVACIKPDLVKYGCELSEGAITGFWNSLPFNAKVGLTAGGIASVAYIDPTSVPTMAGIFFSAKLGAELGVRNRRKEDVAEKMRQINEETD